MNVFSRFLNFTNATKSRKASHLEHCHSGRFCSQRCVGAYASKRRAEMIAEQFAMGARPIPKSGRKKKREIKVICLVEMRRFARFGTI